MKRNGLTLKIILPILLLVIGILVTLLLVKTRSVPEPVERSFSGPLVEVMPVSRVDLPVVVSATGTVRARQAVELTPQVSGRVVSISPRMVEGGFFRAGEELFSLERIDYQLAVERARANLAQAELELERTRSLAEIARLEWQRLPQPPGNQPTPLTLYQPQLKNAEAQLAAARAAIGQAELDLERTVLRAPFNCYIRSEQVDLGQYLRAGTPVATVAGTDAVEIVVPLPLEELSWLRIPRGERSIRGSQARVVISLQTRQREWLGEIVRAHGEVDPQTRMASVVVAVKDPYGQQQTAGPGADLTPGMFVEVWLQGRVLEDVIALPREALRDHETVWVAEGDRLSIRQVEIARRERTQVLVSSGLEPGDQVVLTGLSAAAEGMQLRPQLAEGNR